MAEDDIMEKVNDLQNKGFSDSQIYDSLKREGFSSLQIDDAINQVRLGRPDAEIEEAPEPGLRPSLLNEAPINESIQQGSRIELGNVSEQEIFQGRGNIDEVEALIESILEEKWKNTLQRFGNLDMWKERVKIDVGSLKQEIIRLENRFDNIEKAILGKISQYDKNIVSIGNEMKVLEQVFQKIITPLTENIRELSRITKELKK